MHQPEACVLIGTAGWSLPRSEQLQFATAGSHLERYASRFPAVEINSSFHRSHKPVIWARWRDAVPAEFRFSVKIPKTITHAARLNDAQDLVAAFLDEIAVLEEKLGCLLVQLPPSLRWAASSAERFFEDLRSRTMVPIACEPRHATWFTTEADHLFRRLGVARVAADPARAPFADEPGGSREFSYFRLHGSPKVYYSAYANEYLKRLGSRLCADAAQKRTVWCIFDNTTLGAATRNALDLQGLISHG